MAIFENKSDKAGFGLGVIDSLINIGGLIGNSISTKKTNQMNYRIAQMNNEFNERMMREQMAWSEGMWNKQNQYNTPGNQRARLEAAGFNPYMMMQGGNNTGVAASASGVGQASASGNPVMQPMDFDTSSISSSVGRLADMMYNYELRRTQIKNINIDNDDKGVKYLAEIMDLRENTRSKEQKRLLDSLTYDITKANYDNILREKELDVSMKETSLDIMNIEKINRKIDLQDKQLFQSIFGSGPEYYDFLTKVYDLELRKKQGYKVDAEIKKLAADTALLWSKKQAQDNINYEWQETHGNRIYAENLRNIDESMYYYGRQNPDGTFSTPASRRTDAEVAAGRSNAEFGEGNEIYYKIVNGLERVGRVVGTVLGGAGNYKNLLPSGKSSRLSSTPIYLVD